MPECIATPVLIQTLHQLSATNRTCLLEAVRSSSALLPYSPLRQAVADEHNSKLYQCDPKLSQSLKLCCCSFPRSMVFPT